MEGVRGLVSGGVRRRALLFAVGLAAGALLFALLPSAPGAAAGPKKIAGKLTKPGLDVVALAKSGKASLKRTKGNGKFKLRPPARKVTLHLRAADGTYAGPIVVGKKKKGKRAVLGVRAGAKLGKVKVKSAKGFAKPKRKLSARRVDAKRKARAKRGVPIGAGNFGRVRSKTKRGAPGDLDKDGIANQLDIDDDGDLVLDSVDDSSAGGAARVSAGGATRAASTSESPNDFGIGSVLDVRIENTANASAGSTQAEIDAASPSWGSMAIGILPGDSAELDCGGSPDPANPDGWIGGLVYCVRGGSGRTLALPPFEGPDGPEHPAFPECCDGDGDGFGTLIGDEMSMGNETSLQHRATVAEFGTGDVLLQHVTTGGSESGCPPPSASCASFASTVPFAFATVPALVSYSDTAGNQANVSYPVGGSANPNDPTPGPGAEGNGLPVSAPPGEDVVLRLTFWRPQRESTPSEQGTWTDIGGLQHFVDVQFPAADGTPKGCPRSAYLPADPPDEELVPAEPSPFTEATGFKDLAPDRPASVAETFTYRLNVTECLGGTPWNPGEELRLQFAATDEPPVTAHTQQDVWFERE